MWAAPSSMRRDGRRAAARRVARTLPAIATTSSCSAWARPFEEAYIGRGRDAGEPRTRFRSWPPTTCASSGRTSTMRTRRGCAFTSGALLADPGRVRRYIAPAVPAQSRRRWRRCSPTFPRRWRTGGDCAPLQPAVEARRGTACRSIRCRAASRRSSSCAPKRRAGLSARFAAVAAEPPEYRARLSASSTSSARWASPDTS